MKTQINFRASNFTGEQLAKLVARSGMNQTEVISVAIDRMFREETMNTQSLSETLTQIQKFARACADAYVNQFVDPDGKKVMNQPVVYFNRDTTEFDWTSSLVPLSDNEVSVETLEEGIYGETGSDPQKARDEIEEYITRSIDYMDLWNKIEPE